MVLDSQAQIPLGLQGQHALNAEAVKGSPLFSSGGYFPQPPALGVWLPFEKELPSERSGVQPPLIPSQALQSTAEPSRQLF